MNRLLCRVCWMVLSVGVYSIVLAQNTWEIPPGTTEVLTAPTTTLSGNTLNTIVSGDGTVLTHTQNANSELLLAAGASLVIENSAMVTNFARIGANAVQRPSITIRNGAYVSAKRLRLQGTEFGRFFIGGANEQGVPATVVLSESLIHATSGSISNTWEVATDGVLDMANVLVLGNFFNTRGGWDKLVVRDGGKVIVRSGTTSYIGNGTSNYNTMEITGVNPTTGQPSVVDFMGLAQRLNITQAYGQSNSVVVANGGVLTNLQIVVGNRAATTSTSIDVPTWSSLVITNGGKFYGEILALGSKSNHNKITVSGEGSLVDASARACPSENSGRWNVFEVTDNAVVTNVASTSSYITGFGIGYIPNVDNFNIADSNRTIVSGGGKVFSRATSYIGAISGPSTGATAYFSENNTLEVTGEGSQWDLAKQNLYVGASENRGTTYLSYVTNNALRVSNYGAVTNVGAVHVGYVKANINTINQGNRLELAGGHFSAQSLTVYPNNSLLVEVGPNGIIPATISGTVTFQPGSSLIPTATKDATIGIHKILQAGTLNASALPRAPVATRSFMFTFDIQEHAILMKVSPPGALFFIR